MVATDTLVGIVGAVVLVAAMAGVFVYEYNNTPDDGSSGLAERFSHLSADGDIDGDGIRNADDTDIDGDGIDNEEDEETVVTTTSSGSVGARAEPATGNAFTEAVVAGEGVRGIHVTALVTPSASDPTGTFSGFQLTVTHEDGATVGSDIGTSELVVSSTEVLPGTFTATVQAAQGSLGGEVELTIELVY